MIDGKNIKPGAITNTNVNSSAGVELKKLEKGSSGQIVVTDSEGTQKYVTLSGDVTVDNDGVATVSSTISSSGTGSVGPQGPAGPQGPTGPQGTQGDAGAPGSDASVTSTNVDNALFGVDTSSFGFVKRTANDTFAVDSNTYEQSFSKNTAFNKNFGTAAGDVCQGNDSRLSDSRTPTAHKSTHATGAADAIAPSDIGAEPAFTKNTAHNKNFGSTAGTVCQGNDSRLSDARTPVSHNHAASDITSGTLADDRVAQSNVTQHQAAIDHDQLTNFSADEHRVIDDTSTTDTDKLWSAYNIVTQLAAKAPYNTATSTTDGLMDNTDKVFLDKLAAQISIPSSGSTAGFIGINDTSPSYRLDVDGTARFTSAVKIGGYTFPVFDGDVGKALVTDGAGTLSFSNIAVANVTGLGDSATKDVGTGSTNVAAGDHTHSTGNNGFVPAAGSSGQFLAHDGTFQTPSSSSLTTEQVQDIVGGMFSGNTETNISATYQDADGTIDLAVENYPSKYTAQITFGGGAQGTPVDFTLTTGSGTVTHNGYILNHNLGTQSFVASVRTPYDPADGNSDDQTPDTWNDLFNHLYWQHMDVGFDGSSITNNSVMISTVNKNSSALPELSDNHCAIAIPVDADDDPNRIYLVTLIG